MSCCHIEARGIAKAVATVKVMTRNKESICHSCKEQLPQLFKCLQNDCTYIGCGKSHSNHIMHHSKLDNWRLVCMKCSTSISQRESDTRCTLEEQHCQLRKSSADLWNIEENLRPRGLCGLTNMGNTCYMNSAIQSLSNCAPLTQFFLKCEAFVKANESGKTSVAVEYCKLMKSMWAVERQRSINPSALARSIRLVYAQFRGYAQQDSQEFLRCIMDRLHDELKKPVMSFHSKKDQASPRRNHFKHESKKLLGGNGSSDVEQPMEVDRSDDDYDDHDEKHSESHESRGCICIVDYKELTEKSSTTYHSIITDVFNGKLKSFVQCLACNRVSTTTENFQDLSLPIPGKDDLLQIHSQRSPRPISCSPNFYGRGWLTSIYNWLESWFIGPQVSLQDCLAAFFAKDELKGDNMYNCEKCNKLRNGVKYLKVLSLPEVLCIHLKRFRHEMYFSSKISSSVIFPVNGLDMRQFLGKDRKSDFTTYDLCAVITHFGNVGGGHYIAYAKNCINNKWYEFNDSTVSEVSEYVVENAEAYVLFYCKRDTADQIFRAQVRESLEKSYSLDPCDGVYISKEWFNRFQTCAEPGQISNFDFLCRHGDPVLDVPPRLTDHVKKFVMRMPIGIWNALHSRYGGGPEVKSLSECKLCKELRSRRDRELQTFLKLNEAYQNDPDQGTAFCLSIAWYKRWHTFAKGEEEEPPEAIDNASILEIKGSKYILIEDSDYGLISSETWNYFYSIYGGGPEFKIENRKGDKSTKETTEENNQNVN